MLTRRRGQSLEDVRTGVRRPIAGLLADLKSRGLLDENAGDWARVRAKRRSMKFEGARS
jgi:hypothetical protein